MSERTAEEWRDFLASEQAQLRDEINDYIAARGHGVAKQWKSESNPFADITKALPMVFDLAGQRLEIGDYSCRFSGEELTIQHHAGVERCVLSQAAGFTVATIINGYEVIAAEDHLTLLVTASITPHWRQIRWMSGTLEPHRKGDLVYVQGFGEQRWYDSGQPITAGRMIHYYPAQYPGYPAPPSRISRGEPVDGKIFPAELRGEHKLPGTDIDLVINYDQWVQRVLDSSGLLTLLSIVRRVYA